MWAFAITWCPSSRADDHPSSVNFSHSNLLLRNHLVKWRETWKPRYKKRYLTPATTRTSSLAKGYNLLYSSSPLASLDGFSRSHGDGLYVMQLVVAATNQNALYTSCLRANKDIFSVYNSRYRFALIVCQWFYIKFILNVFWQRLSQWEIAP